MFPAGGYGGYGGTWPYGGSRSYWSDRLKVGDIISITTLQTDPNGNGTFTDTWTANTDYTLEPFNNASTGSRTGTSSGIRAASSSSLRAIRSR
jgi:hypothetical protein